MSVEGRSKGPRWKRRYGEVGAGVEWIEAPPRGPQRGACPGHPLALGSLSSRIPSRPNLSELGSRCFQAFPALHGHMKISENMVYRQTRDDILEAAEGSPMTLNQFLGKLSTTTGWKLDKFGQIRRPYPGLQRLSRNAQCPITALLGIPGDAPGDRYAELGLTPENADSIMVAADHAGFDVHFGLGIRRRLLKACRLT